MKFMVRHHMSGQLMSVLIPTSHRIDVEPHEVGERSQTLVA